MTSVLTLGEGGQLTTNQPTNQHWSQKTKDAAGFNTEEDIGWVQIWTLKCWNPNGNITQE